MKLYKKLIVLFIVTVSGFGLFYFEQRVQAITQDEAASMCSLKVNKQRCLTAVRRCGATSSTCLTTAVRTSGPNVIRECQTNSDPQKCQRDYVAACGGKTGEALTTCRTTFLQRIATPTPTAQNGSATPAQTDPGFSLGSKADKPYQCGSSDSNPVFTRFNLGCKGTAAQPGTNPIVDMAFALIRFFTIGVGIVLTMSIIYAGLMYTTSGGNPEQTSKAKNRILNAIVGLIFFLLISALAQYLVPGGLF